MDDNQQNTLDHKQLDGTGPEPPKTVQTTDGNDETAKTIESKSLTNIYYDCLERIFEFLNIQSVLKVASTCKRLQIAAAAYFNDRYGKWATQYAFLVENNISAIFNISLSRCDYKRARPLRYKRICLFRNEFCLPFLRCFGSKFLVLEVCGYPENEAYSHYIDYYINQYCADTLTRISYNNRPFNFSSESFRKPFKKVEQIAIESSSAEQISNFVDWFPNLRHLKLGRVSNLKPAHIPSLKRLTVEFDELMDSKDIKDFLRANKQLQMLRFGLAHAIQPKMSDLLDMMSENTSITEFARCHKSDVMSVSDDELFELADKCPRMIALSLGDCLLNGNSADRVIRQMESLKRFRFRINLTEYEDFKTKLDDKWTHKTSNDSSDASRCTITLMKSSLEIDESA